jgi:hypothetical protein
MDRESADDQAQKAYKKLNSNSLDGKNTSSMPNMRYGGGISSSYA